MFCPKCGKRLEAGDRLCPSCGAPVDAAPDDSTSTDAPVAATRPKHRVKIVAAAVALVAVALVAFALNNLPGESSEKATDTDGVQNEQSGNGGSEEAAGTDAVQTEQPKTAAGADGMGNSAANISMGGYAVSAGGMDYFFDQKGLECASADDPGSVRQLRSISDGAGALRGLNYVDGHLYYVSVDSHVETGANGLHCTVTTTAITSMKVDGSDEKTVYSLDQKEDEDYDPAPRLYITGGRIYLTSIVKDQDQNPSLRIVGMAMDGSDVKEAKLALSGRGNGNHLYAVSGDSIFYTDGDLVNSDYASVYAAKLDGSGSKEIYASSYLGAVTDMTVMSGRVVIAGYEDDPNGNWADGTSTPFYVESMSADGSDAMKMFEADDAYSIIGANDDTVYLNFDGTADFSAPIAGGDGIDIKWPSSFKDGSVAVFGADDHVVLCSTRSGRSATVGSMKPDSSDYVEYTGGN